MTFHREEVAAILVELDAILASPVFSGSKRCHDFLECIVQHAAFAGHYDELNERFLGVEFFGRKLDFDTGADSIVSVRAERRSAPSGAVLLCTILPPCCHDRLVFRKLHSHLFNGIVQKIPNREMCHCPRISHAESPSPPADPRRVDRLALRRAASVSQCPSLFTLVVLMRQRSWLPGTSGR